MKFVAFRTMFETEFGDTGSRFRALLLMWTNIVYHEICAAHESWPWLQKTHVFTHTAGDDHYDPETEGTLSVRRVLDLVDKTNTPDRPLKYWGERQFWDAGLSSASQGRPELFRLWENLIYLYPIPSDDRTLQFRYIEQELDLNTSDNAGQGSTILIPDADIGVLYQGVLAHVYRFLDDVRSSQARMDFLKQLADMKTQRSSKSPSVIYPRKGQTEATAVGSSLVGEEWAGSYRVVPAEPEV